MADNPPLVEKVEDFGDDQPEAFVRRWIAEIKSAEGKFKDWREQSKTIIKRFRDDEGYTNYEHSTNPRRYNVLWSMIKILQPLLYSQTPKPEVQRRFKDNDPVARLASEVLERSLSSCMDIYDFDLPVMAARDDYLLVGRGQVWVRYIPTFGDEVSEIDEYGESHSYSPVTYEETKVDYIGWDSFLHSPAPQWEKVTWVAKKELLTRSQLKERFGEVGEKVPLTIKQEGMQDSDVDKYGDVFKRGEVWEIWDKSSREVIWICPHYRDNWLDRQPDPLGLSGFFPCPKPIYSTLTTDSLIPVADYTEWQSQAVELDILTERISLLVKALRVAGVYNSNIGESIQDLLSSNLENRLIPVDEWALFAEQGGFKGSVAFLPIKEVAEVLQQLYVSRREVKQDLYEITGIADIIRGSTEKYETATAQRIKGRFASVRLEDRQRELSRFVRDTLRIKAEIISEHFSPETLLTISNFPHLPAAMGMSDINMFMQAIFMLRDDHLRSFRVDIETDATIAPDREFEKQTRIEFLGSMTPFLEKAVVAMQTAPSIGPLLGHMLMFAVRGFDTGRNVEGAFEEAIEMIGQGVQDPNAAQNEREAQMAMAELELKKQRLMADIDVEQAKIEIAKGELQIEMQKLVLMQQELEQKTGASNSEMILKVQEYQNQLEREARDLAIRQEDIDVKRLRAVNDFQIRMKEIESERKNEVVKAASVVAKESISAEKEADKAETEKSEKEADRKSAASSSDKALAIMEKMIKAHSTDNEETKKALEELTKVTQGMMEALSADREIVRDRDGKIIASRINRTIQ